jgi:hypothetical protein
LHEIERMRHVLVIVALALGALAAAGCASTRVMQQGQLPTRDPLVTVVISEDRRVVEDECRLVPSLGIVRYADRVPSEMAAEIEVHELCHAIAALQAIDDPCHHGNHGFLQARRPR